MFKPKQSFIFILLLTLVICSSISAQKFGKIDDSEWYISAPDDYPEASAVVIFDKQFVKVSLQNVKIERHVRIKVLRSTGIDEVGDQSITYYKKNNKLKHFKAHTITPDGKKHKVEKDAIFDKTFNNLVTKSFSFPQVAEGVILEYRYTINKKYFNLPSWYFQNDIYTLKSSITVSLEAGFAFDMLYRNVPSIYKKPKVESKPAPKSWGMSTLKNYTWEMENLFPIKDEPFMSAVNDYRASLRFLLTSYTYPDGTSEMIVKNWMDQAKGLENWFDDYCNKDKDIKKLTEEITVGLQTQEEKSKAIFEYIKTNYKSSDNYMTRYFKNDKISGLLKEKIGTPEEKNMLVVQMHRAIDIDSWPVLISMRSNGQFDPSYSDHRQFNYIISFVQIGENWEFLDVADRNALYGILQPQCLTNGGFLIDGKNSQLVRMGIKPINSSRNDITTMNINSNGLAICSTSSVMTGYYAAEMLNEYDNTTPKKFVDNFIIDPVGKTISLGEYTCSPDDSNNFIVTGSFSTNELVRNLDENLIVKPISLSFEKNPFNSENRFFPIDFTYAFIYQNIVKINLDKTPKEIHLPTDVLSDLGNMRLSRTSVLEGSTVIITNTLEVFKPEFKSTKYKHVKELFEQLSLLDDEEISFVYETTE